MIGAALWFLRRWWKPILLVLVLAALAAVIAHAVLAYGGRRYQAGHDAVVASDAAAAAQAQQAQQQHASDSALATGTLSHQLNITLPAIEVTTHDAAAKIQAIYLAVPAGPAVCVRPAGVQHALDAALQRANAAASGRLRPYPAAEPAAQPAARQHVTGPDAGSHGPVGTASDGSVRTRGHDPPR